VYAAAPRPFGSAVALVALAALSGCATPEAVRRIEAAHPGARYEASATGCDRRAPATSRRFGGDLHSAWLWSREVVGTATSRPCEAVIEAVAGGARQPVYRVARDSAGRRREKPLPPR
jgi:hypothetical protein